MKLSQVQAETRTWEILVVDGDTHSTEVVRRAAPQPAHIRQAGDVAQALTALQHKPADLVLVNMQIQDNAGSTLVQTIQAQCPAARVVALTRAHNSDTCVGAWRAGAADILFAPLKLEETRGVIGAALGKSIAQQQNTARQRRLRTVCKRLNKARHEISQQVDLLCNDLVRAYQDLAAQLNQTQAITEYASAIEAQTGLEGLMRATMEWVLKKFGPINAAVFLPDSEGNYTLGAYLNLDTPAEDGFIEALSRTLSPQAAAGGLIQLETDVAIDEMFGKEGRALTGRTWLAHGCFAGRECLGVLLLFRNQSVALEAGMASVLQAISPILAEKIGHIMRLHHRLSRLHDTGEESET